MTVAAVVYSHPVHFGQRGLVYGINRKGQHVVIEPMVAGMDICDTVSRFNTVADARAYWKTVVTQLKVEGYRLEGSRK